MLVVGRRALLLAAALVLTGCATNRSELTIDPPQAAAAKPGAPVLVIRTITDARVFEDNPKSANIPSLGEEGASAATAEVKARAVGRKRNTYGKGLGDVLLDNGQTVVGVVRANLTAAFTEAGYAVQAGPTVPAGATTVDVTVRQFWAWVQPGFAQITLNMDIDADLAFSGKGGKKTVSVRSKEGYAIVSDQAWREIILKGLGEFRNQTAPTASALRR